MGESQGLTTTMCGLGMANTQGNVAERAHHNVVSGIFVLGETHPLPVFHLHSLPFGQVRGTSRI